MALNVLFNMLVLGLYNRSKVQQVSQWADEWQDRDPLLTMRYYVQMRAVKSRKVDLEKSQRQVEDQKRFEATSCSPIRLIMQHQLSY